MLTLKFAVSELFSLRVDQSVNWLATSWFVDESSLTGQFGNKPTRGQLSYWLVNSQTVQFAH